MKLKVDKDNTALYSMNLLLWSRRRSSPGSFWTLMPKAACSGLRCFTSVGG